MVAQLQAAQPVIKKILSAMINVSINARCKRISLCFNGHFPCGPGLAGTRMDIIVAKDDGCGGVVVTTGAIRCAKFQSNHHHVMDGQTSGDSKDCTYAQRHAEKKLGRLKNKMLITILLLLLSDNDKVVANNLYLLTIYGLMKLMTKFLLNVCETFSKNHKCSIEIHSLASHQRFFLSFYYR